MTAGFGKGSANLRICVRASGLAFYCFLMILDPPLPGRLGLFPIGIDSISVLLPLLSWSACARKHTQRLVKRERERERERVCMCQSAYLFFIFSSFSSLFFVSWFSLAVGSADGQLFLQLFHQLLYRVPFYQTARVSAKRLSHRVAR